MLHAINTFRLLLFVSFIGCSLGFDKDGEDPIGMDTNDTDITDTDTDDTDTDDTDDTGDTAEVIDPIEANREHPTTTCSGGGVVTTSSGISGSYCFAPIAIGSQFETSSASYTLQVGSTLIVSP